MYGIRACLFAVVAASITTILHAQEVALPQLSTYLRIEVNRARGEPGTTPITAEYLASIESFSLPEANDFKFVDLRGIEHLVNLRELNLSFHYIPDLSVLTPLKNLRSLQIRYIGVEDITPLAELTNLEVLDLSENRIEDYSPLAALVNLRSLTMGGWYVKHPPSVVVGHPHLGSSNPDDDPYTPPPSPPTPPVGLHPNLPSDWSFLYSLSSLEALVLSRSKLENLDFLVSVPQLKQFVASVSTFPLSIPFPEQIDFSALSYLTELEHLSLAYVEMEDVSTITRLTNLRELNLSGCALTDITGLRDLHDLERVTLFGNADLAYPNILMEVGHLPPTALDALKDGITLIDERPHLADLDGDVQVTFVLNAVLNKYTKEQDLTWAWRWDPEFLEGDSHVGKALQLTVAPGRPILVGLYPTSYPYRQPYDFHEIAIDDAYIPDPALRSTVGGVSPASVESVNPQMQSLDAAALGVTTLEGLAYFQALRQIDISSNAIEDISSLLDFPALELVNITGNPLDLTPGAPAATVIERLRENGVVVLDREWSGFPADGAGNVNTGAVVGWVYASDDTSWVWSWTLDKLVYIPSEGVSNEGAWILIPHNEGARDAASDETWAGFPFLEGVHVDTYSLLSWIVAPPNTPWVFSWKLNNWIYLPETAVNPTGAWVYALR